MFSLFINILKKEKSSSGLKIKKIMIYKKRKKSFFYQMKIDKDPEIFSHVTFLNLQHIAQCGRPI